MSARTSRSLPVGLWIGCVAFSFAVGWLAAPLRSPAHVAPLATPTTPDATRPDGSEDARIVIGTVHTRSGEPLARVTVTAHVRAWAPGLSPRERRVTSEAPTLERVAAFEAEQYAFENARRRSATTDDDGRFRLGGLLDHDYQLVAECDGWLIVDPVYGDAPVRPDAGKTELAFTAFPCRSLEVRVFDRHGIELPFVRTRVASTVDDDGFAEESAQLSGVPRGERVRVPSTARYLSAQLLDASWSPYVELPASDDEAIEIHPPQTLHVSGVVTGIPAERSLLVRVARDDGSTPAPKLLGRALGSTQYVNDHFDAPSPGFHFDVDEPGRYWIGLSPDRGSTWPTIVPVWVASGEEWVELRAPVWIEPGEATDEPDAAAGSPPTLVPQLRIVARAVDGPIDELRAQPLRAPVEPDFDSGSPFGFGTGSDGAVDFIDLGSGADVPFASRLDELWPSELEAPPGARVFTRDLDTWFHLAAEEEEEFGFQLAPDLPGEVRFLVQSPSHGMQEVQVTQAGGWQAEIEFAPPVDGVVRVRGAESPEHRGRLVAQLYWPLSNGESEPLQQIRVSSKGEVMFPVLSPGEYELRIQRLYARDGGSDQTHAILVTRVQFSSHDPRASVTIPSPRDLVVRFPAGDSGVASLGVEDHWRSPLATHDIPPTGEVTFAGVYPGRYELRSEVGETRTLTVDAAHSGDGDLVIDLTQAGVLGAKVESVSPFCELDLRPGDQIETLGSTHITGRSHWHDLLLMAPNERDVRLSIVRDGASLEVTLPGPFGLARRLELWGSLRLRDVITTEEER